MHTHWYTTSHRIFSTAEWQDYIFSSRWLFSFLWGKGGNWTLYNAKKAQTNGTNLHMQVNWTNLSKHTQSLFIWLWILTCIWLERCVCHRLNRNHEQGASHSARLCWSTSRATGVPPAPRWILELVQVVSQEWHLQLQILALSDTEHQLFHFASQRQCQRISLPKPPSHTHIFYSQNP